MLVDSHCHIDFPELGDSLFDVLGRAYAAGVSHLLCVCVNLEDYPNMLLLTEPYSNIFVTVGIHPNTAFIPAREPKLAGLIELASDPRVVGIGETGLDYFRSSGDLGWQRRRFAQHIAAANSIGKPLVIHTRNARKDTIDLMRSENARGAGGVMHCFSEDWTTAKAALDLGFYISFSGIVTFKNAQALREIALKVPDDRILVETDAPYLAPEPHRGKINEPAFVSCTAERIADLKGISMEAFAELTSNNFFQLFQRASRHQA